MQEQKKQKLKADGYLNSVEPLVIKLIEFLTNNDEYEIGCDLSGVAASGKQVSWR